MKTDPTLLSQAWGPGSRRKVELSIADGIAANRDDAPRVSGAVPDEDITTVPIAGYTRLGHMPVELLRQLANAHGNGVVRCAAMNLAAKRTREARDGAE